MTAIKDNKRHYKNFKINSRMKKNKDFEYEINEKHLERIVTILNQARFRLKNPAVAHLSIRYCVWF